ncbi:Calmodulin-lysine N-methyltransferase like protein [Argiope bruennichi]|uniref:Calmodulin-lysine N-methyltransferase n=1 Tax=Argiope bruennichi TaxID=94029 RepID=A0A8T0ED97_ARGBR|nr:Calmodulin-lysine N-methyltransferase like protein [Argiope bruennichi]
MAVDYRHERLKSLSNNKDSELSIAKMRWKMLARALQEGKVQDSLSYPCSVRQFTTFGLIHMLPTDDIENDNGKDRWLQCSCLEEPRLKLKIRLLSGRITCDELKGFDNTGNVCIWPSEEVLTYYCMKNKELFGGNSVCELGGGMACLSGLAIAATAGAKEVFVTDGNMRCVENVKCIIEQNRQYFGATHVVSRLLRWDVVEDLADLKSRFDVVICADCLYYDDGRHALAETIWKILKVDGVAVILSPTRGKTFQYFVDIVEKDFMVERLMAYDTHVWELNCRLKEAKSSVYDEDLHYPQMLILRKF